jgi:hypothetical protein
MIHILPYHHLDRLEHLEKHIESSGYYRTSLCNRSFTYLYNGRMGLHALNLRQSENVLFTNSSGHTYIQCCSKMIL